MHVDPNAREAGLTIELDELRPALEGGAQLYDVLPRASFLQGHLPGAVSLPLAEIEPALANGDPRLPSDPDAQIIVYCGGPT